MKSVEVELQGRIRIIRFDPVYDHNGLIYTHVYDKHGQRYLFIKNDRGNFIGTWKSRHFPDYLDEAINSILQKEIPVKVFSDSNFKMRPIEDKDGPRS